MTVPEAAVFEPHPVDLDARGRAVALWGRGGFDAARIDRREFHEWIPSLGSADSDALPDLPMLRARSRDMLRNDPLAVGAHATLIDNTVGTGLLPQPQIDREYLGLDAEEAKRKQSEILRYWYAWAEGKDADLTRRRTFAGLTRIVLGDVLADGDLLVLRRRETRRGAVLPLQAQLVEADRLSNPNDRPDEGRFRAGIESDAAGEPRRYWVRSAHPGELGLGTLITGWTSWPAYGARSGERLALHCCVFRREGQSRGVPLLAPVLGYLKQRQRYIGAELMATVISSFFTVFLKQEYAGDVFGLARPLDNDALHFGPPLQPQIKLGHGSIVGLAPGESVELAESKRPNQNFDPFVLAISREIGVAMGLPFELLVKHFTSSYSAARAARVEFWRTVLGYRAWLVGDWAQPCYEWVLAEAVLSGRLDLPGFFEDPLARRAWSFTQWTGPTQGQIDPLAEVQAAVARIRNYLSSHQEEAAGLTGGDWAGGILPQILQERADLGAAGLMVGPPEGVRETPDQAAQRRERQSTVGVAG